MNTKVIAKCSVILSLAMSLTAAAQPDPNATGLKQNPQNVDAETAMRQAQQAGMQQAMKMAHMTPQERQAEMQRIFDQLLRSSLDRAGFKDQTLQATILGFVAEQEKSRQQVRAAAAKLETATEPGVAAAVEPATIDTYINDYLATVVDAKVAREAAAADLDKRINFSNIPRLKAWLLLNGLIGEAASLTGNLNMMSTMTMSALALMPPPDKPATPVAPRAR